MTNRQAPTTGSDPSRPRRPRAPAAAKLGSATAAGKSLNRAARRHPDLAGRLAVSPAEAASLLGINRDTLYGLMNAGTVHSVKVGGRRLIAVSELHRLLGDAEAS